MVNPAIEKEIHEQLNHLALDQQRQVLEFARALTVSKVRGIPGSALLRFAGVINTEDLDIISRTIEEDCEKVSLNEW